MALTHIASVTAFGVGEKAVTETTRKTDFHPDGSEYSDGRRERALGLEEIKFTRAVGEGSGIRPGHAPGAGLPRVVEPSRTDSTAVDRQVPADTDTPSTLVRESYGAPLAAPTVHSLASPGIASASAVNPTQPIIPPNARSSPTITLNQQLQATPASSAASERVMRGIMDQRGFFELASQSAPSQWAEERPGFAGHNGRMSGISATGVGVNPPSSTKSPPPESTVEPLSDKNTAEPSAPVILATPALTQPSVSAPTPLTTLPAASGSQNPSSPPAHPPLASTSPGLNVLVVDDDVLTRKLMSRMLTRLGCNVDTAENGRIALDKILGPNVDPPDKNGETAASTSATPPRGGHFQGLAYDIVFLDNQMVCPLLTCYTFGRADVYDCTT